MLQKRQDKLPYISLYLMKTDHVHFQVTKNNDVAYMEKRENQIVVREKNWQT